jgi:hypothetical protein
MGFEEQSFAQRFKDVVDGLDTRLRAAEMNIVVMQTKMDNLKNDNCVKHDKSIGELYDSRNAANMSGQALKQSLNGVSKVVDAHSSKIAEVIEAVGTMQTQLNNMADRHANEDRRETTYFAPVITGVASAMIGGLLSFLASMYVMSQHYEADKTAAATHNTAAKP